MSEKKEKAKKKAPAKPAEPPAKKPAELLQERVLAIMQKLKENGITEFTSRLISDKLDFADPDKGRNKIRRAMKALGKDGKVAIAVKAGAKRKQYVYKLVEK